MNQCERCGFMLARAHTRDDEWCYMFRDRPIGRCAQYTPSSLTPLAPDADDSEPGDDGVVFCSACGTPLGTACATARPLDLAVEGFGGDIMPDYEYHLLCFNAGYSITMNGPLKENVVRQPYMTKSTRLAYEAGVAAAREVESQRKGEDDAGGYNRK